MASIDTTRTVFDHPCGAACRVRNSLLSYELPTVIEVPSVKTTRTRQPSETATAW